MCQHLKRPCIRNSWLKLLTMYSYSMPFELIDEFPAELAILHCEIMFSSTGSGLKAACIPILKKSGARVDNANVEIAAIFKP